jgi:UDP-N-acetylmuramyl pentapeptide phosphotransferase/UDP-N-acetylglucosamine-1-phosphate transferase
MTQFGSSSLPELPANRPPRRAMWKIGIVVLLRVTFTIAVLMAAYYLIPTVVDGGESDVPWLIVALAVFGVVVGIQVPAIVKSKYPGVRAIEALAVTIPLFLLIFARLYLSNSLANPATFTVPLDHNSALYFTVTVFATVGFGDITPKTGGMQLLVTVQMLLNLAVLGLVIRLLTSTAKQEVARRGRGGRDGGSAGVA